MNNQIPDDGTKFGRELFAACIQITALPTNITGTSGEHNGILNNWVNLYQ